jgi:hypothetical protein
MPINKRKNILFVHIPKCAGSSVAKSFDMKPHDSHAKNIDLLYGIDDNGLVLQSMPLDYYSKYLDDVYINKCFKFTVVRNPYTRAVSDFKWSSRGFKDFYGFLNYIKGTRGISTEDMLKYNLNHTNHLLTQSFYIQSDNFEIDKILKLENLDEEFKDTFPDEQLCHINQTPPTDYKKFYKDTRCIDLVQELFQEDFDNFGYSLTL